MIWRRYDTGFLIISAIYMSGKKSLLLVKFYSVYPSSMFFSLNEIKLEIDSKAVIL